MSSRPRLGRQASRDDVGLGEPAVGGHPLDIAPGAAGERLVQRRPSPALGVSQQLGAAGHLIEALRPSPALSCGSRRRRRGRGRRRAGRRRHGDVGPANIIPGLLAGVMRRGGVGLLVLSDCWGSTGSCSRSRGRPSSDARRPRRKPGPPTSRPWILAQALIIPRLRGRSPGLRSDDALMYARPVGTPSPVPRSGFDPCPRGRRQLYPTGCRLCSRCRSRVVVGLCFILSVVPRVVAPGGQSSGDTVAKPPAIYERCFTSVASRPGLPRTIRDGRRLRDGLRLLTCHAS